MNLSSKNLIKILQEKWFYFSRAKGSHQLFYNQSSNKTVIVPVHGSKGLKKGTFLAILKQAGIDKMNYRIILFLKIPIIFFYSIMTSDLPFDFIYFYKNL